MSELRSEGGEVMPIKNYTTKVPASKTASEINQILAKHGARRIMTEYNDGGEPISISFEIEGSSFTLPVRVEAVEHILSEQGIKADRAKAERVAWRNVKDWIDAQIALIETGQADLEEVMLPYMIDRTGKTLYEALPALCLEGVGFDG